MKYNSVQYCIRMVMAAWAVLSVAACSDRNTPEPAISGANLIICFTGVEHADPMSGTFTRMSDGEDISIEYRQITIELTDAHGVRTFSTTEGTLPPSDELTPPDNLSLEELLDGWNSGMGKGFRITEVDNPQKLSVSINGGTDEFMKLTPELVNAGLAVPLYAEVTHFTYTAERDGHPVCVLVITPQHRMARLEFAGVKIEGANSSYTDVVLQGAFLNNVLPAEQAAVPLHFDGWKAGLLTALSMPGGTPETPVVLPDSKGFAFNIFPTYAQTSDGWNTEVVERWKQKSGTVSRWVPSLTLVFNARRKDTGKEQLLYAVVTKYTESNGELIDMFEPGCIYRFGTVTVDVAKNLLEGVEPVSSGGSRSAALSGAGLQIRRQ